MSEEVANVHFVPRLRAAVAVSTALLLLAGCGSGPGVAKETFPRVTVPANVQNAADPTKPSAAPGKPVDPAFAVEKLRLIDTCRLLGKDVLKQLGTPAESHPSSYTRCSNYMKDENGRQLNITLELGYTMTLEADKANKQIAGLRSHEQKLDAGACFVSVITQQNPALGLRAQIGYKDAGDACEPGRKVLDAAVKQIKKDAPKVSAVKGSPIGLDPCALPGQGMLREAVGEASRQVAYGIHQCSWNTRNVTVSLGFRSTYVPDGNKFDDKQQEIDLGGGVKGYQVRQDGSYPTCQVILLLTKDGKNNGEVAEVESSGAKEVEFDRCARAQAFAKAILPKLPKA